MCLVSYIPLEQGFVLSSNRDESPLRAASHLKKVKINTTGVVFPEDVQGGSWICMSAEAEVYCVLNGAFQIHKRNLPYKMSRGKMLMRIFEYADAVDFLENFDFHGIEPFTMVMKTKASLFEFRWDESVKHIKVLDPTKHHIWSSCTLYAEGPRQMREKWFNELLDQNQFTPEEAANIHLSGGKNDIVNGFVMNRKDIVRTVSLTQVISDTQTITMLHRDLLSDLRLRSELNISQSTATEAAS